MKRLKASCIYKCENMPLLVGYNHEADGRWSEFHQNENQPELERSIRLCARDFLELLTPYMVDKHQSQHQQVPNAINLNC